LGDDNDEILTSGGKWEDEEERRFFEDLQDLKDFVPKSVLGLESEAEEDKDKGENEETEKIEKERVAEEVRKLEEELEGLKLSEGSNGHAVGSAAVSETEDANDDDDEYVTKSFRCSLQKLILFSIATPTPGSPKVPTPPLSPFLAPQGPTQLLTSLLARLPDATNRALVDQAAVDFAFLNSKAARKRLIKVNYLRLYLRLISIAHMIFVISASS
jgi:regulator of nonsense transcripts 2